MNKIQDQSFSKKSNWRSLFITTIVLVAVLIYFNLGSVFASSDSDNIRVLQKTKIKESQFMLLVDYCTTKQSSANLGILAISDAEKKPIIVDSKTNSCQKYGTKIHTEKSPSIKLSTFTKKELPALTKDLENNKKNLEIEIVKLQQELRKAEIFHVKNDERIATIQKEIAQKQSLYNSIKESLRVLKAVNYH